jgi:fucose permease
MQLVARRFRRPFAGLFSAFALFGTSMTIVGAALPTMLGDFGWSYAAAGAVIAAGAAAYTLSSLASGAAMRRIGPKAAILIGLAACSAGLALFASSPALLANLLLYALVGAGQGFIEPSVNLSVLRMDEDGSGRAMNVMHGAFSIGAVAGPVILGAIIAAGLGWTVLFRALAALIAAVAAFIATVRFPPLPSEAPGAAGGAAPRSRPALSRNPAYWLGFACLFAYVGVELGISNWIAEYFTRIFGAPAAAASLMVSLFWLGLLAGRFGWPAAYRGSRQDLALVGSSILLVAAASALCALGFASPTAADARGLGAPAAIAAIACTFVAGLGCSIIYPTTVALVGLSCPDAQAGAVSFAVAGGGVGLFAFPFVMSWIAQGLGIRSGFASYAVVAALTALSCFALARTFAARKMR